MVILKPLADINGNFFIGNYLLNKLNISMENMRFPQMYILVIAKGNMNKFKNYTTISFDELGRLEQEVTQSKLIDMQRPQLYNLPRNVYPYKEYLNDVFYDKKNLAGTISFIFLEELGKCMIYKLTEAEIKEKFLK